MMHLIPCPACQRHIYVSETSCPFCNAARDPGQAPAMRRPRPVRMSRAALVALGLSSVACGGDTEENGGDSDTESTATTTATTSTVTSVGGNPNDAANAVYGGPAVSFNAVSAGGNGSDGGVPIYGAPATGGSPGAGGTAGTSSMAGAAGESGDGIGGGTPLPPDGGGVPVYGAPPDPER